MSEASAPRPLVLVTGLSGAGKQSILRVLEDLGYETVDNPPLAILETLVREGTAPMAAGIDARSRGFQPQLALAAIARLRGDPGVQPSLIFATAEEGVLLRRYTETRRRHPLAPGAAPGGAPCGALGGALGGAPGGKPGDRVQDGIAREAALLEPLREAADLVVDTSDLPIPELRRMIEGLFGLEGGPGLNLLVQSFAFPKGLPREADLVFDVRFLRNPHYDTALRPMTGLDAPVAAFVTADPDFPAFRERLIGFVAPLLPRYVAEGKKYLSIAIGCSGGRHRSVFTAEQLAAHLRAQGWRVDVAHRELAVARATLPTDGRPGVAPHPDTQSTTGAPAPQPPLSMTALTEDKR